MTDTQKASEALRTALRIHEALTDQERNRELSDTTQIHLTGLKAAITVALEQLEG